MNTNNSPRPYQFSYLCRKREDPSIAKKRNMDRKEQKDKSAPAIKPSPFPVIFQGGRSIPYKQYITPNLGKSNNEYAGVHVRDAYKIGKEKETKARQRQELPSFLNRAKQ